MPYKTTWKDRLENAEPFFGPVIAGTVVLALAGWLTWHTFGPAKTPRPLASAPKDEVAPSTAVRQVASEVEVLEKTYRRALESGAAPDVTAAMLNRVIEKQNALLRLGSGPNSGHAEKLAGLEAERASQRASSALARSKVLEAEAVAAQAAGLKVEAREKMREALRLQQEANANAGAPALKDVPRESRLAQDIDAADAGPALAVVTSFLTLARSAAARENWEEALKNFSEARKAQEDLNQRFPGTRYADVKAVDQIDGEIESVQAGGLVVTSRARERDGEAAAKAGRAQEAGASFAAAAAAQRELNLKFPRSRFASPTRLTELDVRRQTALSEVKLNRASAIDRDITGALRRRQNVAAAEKLAEASKLMETVAADFPLSSALNPTLQRKLAYLALRAGELDTLQEQVLSRLAPVPGAGGLQMLTTEVPQELYQRVMNLNPSRNAGRGLPVDSVSWVDAQEFCERVSWLLGLRVRLPSEAEFAAAWSAAGDRAWSGENSEGRSRETGKSVTSPAGFYDLAGNLAEWLRPVTEAGEFAPVAGGSYLDANAALQTLKVVQTERRERARHIGLRIVVEAASN